MEDSEDIEHVANRVVPVWGRVIEDMEATAEEYREANWTALECHPGDVAAIAEAEDRTGLDILLPDDEFDRIEAAYDEGGAFDSVEVFRAEQSGMVFAVAALENETTETVLLVPLYYDTAKDSEFVEKVEAEDELQIHLRPLDQRRVITFTQTDPEPFLPPAE
jgi:hypothetical protein